MKLYRQIKTWWDRQLKSLVIEIMMRDSIIFFVVVATDEIENKETLLLRNYANHEHVDNALDFETDLSIIRISHVNFNEYKIDEINLRH